MDFRLSEEQELIRNMVREFAESEVRPIASEIDKNKRFPVETIARLKELNLLGVPFPEEYGGAGADAVSFAIVMEEISRACASTGDTVASHTGLGTYPIFEWGTEAQKKKYMVPLARGEMLGAFCLTEPAAGSDAGAVQTTAVLRGDKYVLNGNKIFTTNAGRAEVYIVMAMTDKSKGTKGISAFIVEKGFPGFQLGQLEEKMGLHGTENREIIFKDCEVPRDNLLGGEGVGFKVAMNALDFGRIGIGGPGSRDSPGRPGSIDQLFQGKASIRPPHLQFSGDPVDDGRHGHPRAGGPPPGLPRGLDERLRRPLFHGSRHGQVVRFRDRHVDHDQGRADSRRIWVHHALSG